MPVHDLKRSHLKKTIWLTRPDLRSLFSNDQLGFETWLLTNGLNEYPGLEQAAIDDNDFLALNTIGAIPAVRPSLTNLMKLVWVARQDLQALFDLNTIQGQQDFVWWYFLHGIKESGHSQYLTSRQKHILGSTVYGEPDEHFKINVLMLKMYKSRQDLQSSFNLETREGRYNFATWYFVFGVTELGYLNTLTEDQLRMLEMASEQVPTISNFSYFLWSWGRFPGSNASGPDSQEFRDWLNGPEAKAEFPLLEMMARRRKKARQVQWRSKQVGVNLIGYAKGQFGIGEDVRMAARSFQAAGVPFIIYNIKPSPEITENDLSMVAHISTELVHPVNIFCATGFETARLAAVEGLTLFEGHYNIGYWPWELADWPTEWSHAYELVDEIWASSKFAFETYSKSFRRLVRHLPMAVTTDETSGLARHDFRIPEGSCSFVFAFDALSSFCRKNPLAVIRAFRRAFPRGDEQCTLVIKAMRIDMAGPEWQELRDASGEDGRVLILTSTLDRGGVLDLYRVSDCFVSLHRSEGFGRGLVEALILGAQTVATAYSGNMDYMSFDENYLVEYELIELQQGEYPFGDGQVWAEPDIECASRYLRHFAGLNKRQRLPGDAFVREVKARYSPSAVGATYRAELERIFS